MKSKLFLLTTMLFLSIPLQSTHAGLFDSLPSVDSLKEKAMQEAKDSVAAETKTRQDEAVATVKDKAKSTAKDAGRSISSKKAPEAKTQE